MKHRLLDLLKLLLAVGAIAYLLASGQLNLRDFQRVADGWYWLIPANLLLMVMFVVTITRWRLLMQAQGIPLTYPNATRLTFIGFFFNSFMPGAVGGDLIKAYYAAKESPSKRAEAVTAVMADRLLGMMGLALVAGLAMLFNLNAVRDNADLLHTAWAVLGLLVGASVGMALLLSDTVRGWAWVRALHLRLPLAAPRRSVYQALYLYKSRPRVLVAAVALSTLNHISAVAIFFCLTRSIGYTDIPTGTFIFIVPLGLCLNAIPLTPGSLGVGELAFGKLIYLVTGQEENLGPVLFALYHLLMILWSQVGLVFYLRSRQEIRAVVDSASQAKSEAIPPV